MNSSVLVEYCDTLEAIVAYNHANQLAVSYKSFYDWQRRFNKATATNHACLLMAANQVGKTRTGCTMDAYHLTGDYPEDWEGYKFDFPPMLWLLGYSGEKTRDLLQTKLFGRLIDNAWEGGLVPADKIIDHISMGGTSRAMRTVRVKHISGISTCQFWSYSQGQHALMGDKVDWYHIDEEPEDQEIHPQVVTRTLNGDRGRRGRGILTFTPENGKTELVCRFQDEENAGQYWLNATWDDCPHISQEDKEEILSQYPVYQRDMRSKGIPLMGSGLIFEVNEALVKCDPFEIPLHFEVINGMDFGWDHPQAHIQLAIDLDNGIFYVCKAFKRQKLQPFEAWQVVKAWGEDVPVAWPQDGLQTRENGLEKRDLYIEAGFNFLDEHATWEGGGVSVEVGLLELNRLFNTGQLRIFSTLVEVFDEIRQYHRKTMPSGATQIVKIKDDLLDAIRYAYMMRRNAVRLVSLSDEEEYYEPIDNENYNATGY